MPEETTAVRVNTDLLLKLKQWGLKQSLPVKSDKDAVELAMKQSLEQSKMQEARRKK